MSRKAKTNEVAKIVSPKVASPEDNLPEDPDVLQFSVNPDKPFGVDNTTNLASLGAEAAIMEGAGIPDDLPPPASGEGVLPAYITEKRHPEGAWNGYTFYEDCIVTPYKSDDGEQRRMARCPSCSLPAQVYKTSENVEGKRYHSCRGHKANGIFIQGCGYTFVSRDYRTQINEPD